jgi:hypothetical protein
MADLSERPEHPPVKHDKPALRRYHVALPPDRVLARLRAHPGVNARARGSITEGPNDAEYELIIGDHEFTVHCGPPVVRGQSAIGLLRLLHLHGTLTETSEGTLVELSFRLRRPQWALQRWVGFFAVAGLGLLWVLIGPGVLAKKALLYGALMLVLAPVIVHDLRRSDQVDDQRRALLNLVEHILGPIQLDDAHPDEPYRRRSLGVAKPDHVGEDEDEDADDDAPNTPEKT